LVDDVITPLILTPALRAAHAQDLDKLSWGAVKYGKFLSAIIKIVVIAFALFLIVKGLNRLNRKKPTEAAPPALTTQEKLLMEIRDSLKKSESSLPR
jgi:large conductance mechanosensitive channel